MPCSSTPRRWRSITQTVHSVDAPPGTFRVLPLVAEFRVRGPPPSEAFTFMLVNVLVDPRRGPQELDSLADVSRAARDSGHGEDDIIMLGDLDADPEHLGRLGDVPGLVAAVNGIPTTTRGTRPGRQHPLRPPRHGRVHRPLRRVGHDSRVGPHAARGPRGLRAPARLGRVQFL